MQCFDKTGVSRVVERPFWGKVSGSSVQGRENEKSVDVVPIKVGGLLTSGRCSEAKFCFG